jgi:hypothetical protein
MLSEAKDLLFARSQQINLCGFIREFRHGAMVAEEWNLELTAWGTRPASRLYQRSMFAFPGGSGSTARPRDATSSFGG